ncbi:biotin--[acetyl-CoA-carboxylase] ligase [archaeon]|nr:biotin--[acetyl-CoA-carboxylase] ligase [archaeon]
MSIHYSVSRYGVLGSTNDFIRRHYKDLPHCAVVVADSQTRGRGRFGRKWHSGKGGLWFSVLFRHRDASRSFLLNFAAAASVASVLRSIGIPAVVKWPNDVLVGKRKVCGILSENIIQGKSVWSVVGIGINVNNHVPLRSATSVKLELGREFDKESLLKKILSRYSQYLSAYKEENDEVILSDWCCYWQSRGKEVCVHTIHGDVKGTASSIDSEGSLFIRSRGMLVKIVEGDVF